MYDYEKRKLTFQLVPSTCWYTNLRSILPNWSEISYNIRLKNQCDICGTKSDTFDAHEVWKYDDIAHIQSLDKIICVCKNCHNVIHFGHTQIEGDSELAYEWYKKINNLTDEQADKDIGEAFTVWEYRSKFNWKLNKVELFNRVEELTGISCNIDMPINGRYYAKVAYKDKDNAKKLGAKWDNNRKLWYFLNEDARNKWYKEVDYV